MPRKCLKHPDTWCYVWGEMTFQFQRRNFAPLIKKCFELYFGCKVGGQDKSWALYICCITCVRLLTGCVKVRIKCRSPFPCLEGTKSHSSDCYFCLTNITRIVSKSKPTVKYPDLPPAMRPVPHKACTKASGKSDFQRWQIWFWWVLRTARMVIEIRHLK